MLTGKNARSLGSLFDRLSNLRNLCYCTSLFEERSLIVMLRTHALLTMIRY